MSATSQCERLAFHIWKVPVALVVTCHLLEPACFGASAGRRHRRRNSSGRGLLYAWGWKTPTMKPEDIGAPAGSKLLVGAFAQRRQSIKHDHVCGRKFKVENHGVLAHACLRGSLRYNGKPVLQCPAMEHL